ncbi:HAMP domain-containing histidine kinase [Salinimonas sp. HHU 13199]|uniref:histidine kinase n=1 Tax=Salinimonas profundi TaxID=2729140 RepID=A0ABR8LJA8_9ALTE|nr:HAMP domain-containing sensor histidine kinase [Salinimonas profundi]MBD3585847.1 HAMP domain-containing histidine kinase [Salinimonas profundi]
MNKIKSSRHSATLRVINLLESHRLSLINQWVRQVKEEFGQEVSLTDAEFADHMVYIIDALIEELLRFYYQDENVRQQPDGDLNYDEGEIEDKKHGGKKHGQQRAGIHAYNADKIYWEYTILRKVLVEFLQKHQVLDIDHLEIVTCVIEQCTRESMSVFTESLHATQRKLLGTVVHDIRSPLYVISMLGELAKEQHSIVHTPAFGQRIHTATGRISAMLEDMLQTLSLESGQGIEINFKDGDFTSFLSSVAEDAVHFYGERLKLSLPDSQIAYTFDEIIFRRVLENLISNAFKYGGKESDVTIRADVIDNNVLVEVHNFGNPIEEAHWKDIFRFLKSTDARDEKLNNSWGIGLAFVKSAVEGHGGSVTVGSSKAEGTRFRVLLPKDQFHNGDSTLVKIE